MSKEKPAISKTKTKMSKEEIKEIDLGEYIVKITYSGDGKLDIDVFDQLGEQIEGIYISNDI